ncbi:hypothetical protein [Actinophytocola sp.]|uniref:hypothetical protein n=1 Tax=Actinophytocola sp. TaxID=1872138 RepID=UPI003899E844
MTSTEPWPLADLPLVGGADFPIGIFWPPHPFEINLARYQEIAASGVTFLITGNYMFDQYINRRALDLANQVGLKVLVNSPEPRLSAISGTLSVTDDPNAPLRISTADARRLLQQMLDEYRPFPSFAGFDVFDEPPPSKFPTVGAVTQLVRELAPAHLPYSNLVPGNGAGYASFVQQFIDTVHPPVLSFDRYPILSGGLDLNYFDNWAIIRRAGLAAGIPTWVYLQSVKFSGRVVPNEAQLRWQINISLAYGAKGVLYFTWWTPEVARGEGFESAIINLDGQRTPLYDVVTRVNKEWLVPIGRELKPLVSVSTTHANDNPLPAGVEAFRPDGYVSRVEGGAVVVGQFRNPTDDGNRWVLVANRSDRTDTTVHLTFGSGANRRERFHTTSASYATTTTSTASVQLAAGGAALFRLGPSAQPRTPRAR